MFVALQEKILFVFAACNALTIPMVWALYPETNQRTLEEMNLLFASDSIWNWNCEKNFAELKEQGAASVDSDNGVEYERKGSVARLQSLSVGTKA